MVSEQRAAPTGHGPSPGPFEDILQLLQDRARVVPERSAILAPGRPALPYRGLLDHVNETLQALRRLGVRRQDRVALVLPNGPEMATAAIGVSAAAVCAPLNPELSLDEFHRYFRDLRITRLLCQADTSSRARGAAQVWGIPVIDLIERPDMPAGVFRLDGARAGEANEDQAPVGHHDAFILPTSGTTSRPKVVPLTHANICRSAYNTGTSLDLCPRDRLLNVLPLFHAHGLISGLMSTLAAGGSVVCTSGFDPASFFALLEEFLPTWYTAVPTIHQAVLAQARLRADGLGRSSLRFIRSASASLPPTVLGELEATFGVPVIETYGMTEAASQVAANPLPPRPRKTGSVGIAAGPEVAVMDDDGRFLGAHQVGEIVLRGPNVTRGYDEEPEANAANFTGGWLRTGDLGHLDHDGYLFLSGRKKEIINRGGQKIAPREIEDVLTEHAAVAQAVAFAVPHPRLGEDAAAAVVLHPGASATPAVLRRFVATRLAAYKVPRQVHLVAEIPKGPTGKIQRIGMAERLGMAGAGSSRRGRRCSSPASPLEHRLALIWSELLGADRIGVHDDFFVLGGDSLVATQVASRVREQFGRVITLRTLFDMPTIAELARHLEEPEGEAADDLSVPGTRLDDRPAPLSYQQRRLYFLDRLGVSGHSYHVCAALRMRGRTDRDALERSLAAIVARHEILRTTFSEQGGEPVQITRGVIPERPRVIDLSSCPESGREDAIRAAARDALREPFDLRNGPLFRAVLVRFDEGDHALVLVFHHLITDGWSQRLFWRELAMHYCALVTDSPIPLSEPPLQYRHYVEWQRKWMNGAAAADQLAYWQRQLEGLSRLPLPTDRERPKTWLPRGARLPVALSRTLTARLRRLGRVHGATLFMTVLAGFQALLYRYTRHPDIAVGSLIANRNRLPFEPLMGMLANTVVLRTSFEGDPSFTDVLRRVRRITLDADQHQDLPFEQVLQALELPRSLDRNAPFQVLFILHHESPAPPPLPGLEVDFVPFDPGSARFDLTLELTETEGGVRGWFEYSTELFERSTIARVSRHLKALLGAVAAEADRPVSVIDFVGSRERKRLEVDWQATAHPVPPPGSVQEAFELQAARTPDAVAVADERRALRFGELNRRANRLARFLTARGAGPGRFVGLMTSRSPDLAVGLLGILKSGAAFMPIDPACPPERLAFMLEDADVRLVVSDLCLAEKAARPGRSVIDLDSDWPLIGAERDDDPRYDLAPDGAAYVLYTSGSTGRPKGVIGTQRGLLNALHWLSRTFPFDEREVCCHKTSISFGDGLQELLGPLLHGRPVVLLDREVIVEPLRLVAALGRHGVTRIILVPSLLRTLLDGVEDLADRLPRLKLWISSGETLSHDLVDRFQERLPGRRLINLYGASEMTDTVTWHEVGGGRSGGRNPPIGRPIQNMEAYVLDDFQQPMPIGLPGELCVAGVGLAHGYLNRSELEREKFVAYPFASRRYPRLYRTGDIARFLPDGTIEHLGRRDDQVQVRGARVELGEVEAALRDHPAVRQAAALAVAEGASGLRLTACVLPEDASLTAGELHRFARGRLPDYMLPSRYVFLDALPRTSSGKIDRQALAATSARATAKAAAGEAPRNATEELVAGIWSQLLEVERVGVFDNFFALGGHSLLAGQLVARVRSLFGVVLPLRAIFDAPTVAEIAGLIEADRSAGSDIGKIALDCPDSPPPGRPSIAQEHALRVERALPGLPIFNLPYAFRLRGRLDVGVLERSLNDVADRHEALRTTFTSLDGRPRLVAAPAAELALAVEIVGADGLLNAERAAELAAKEEAWTPFDVEEGPLFRVRLLELAADDHVLLLTLHHIICDGWSAGILFEDLATAYRTRAAGHRARLPPPPIQFSAYAAWQRRWSDTGEAEAQLAYWRRQLGHAPPAFPPETYGSGLSLDIAWATLALPADLTQALAAFSRRQGSTLFLTLLTAFKAVLRAHTRQEDLSIGTILANRSREQTEHLVGPLENIVVLRTRAEASVPFREALARERSAFLDAHARQELPFDVVAARLKGRDGVDLSSSLQVMFVFQNAIREQLSLSGLEVEPFAAVDRQGQSVLPISQAMMTLILKETAAGLRCTCVYKQDRLPGKLVERLLSDYSAVLHRALEEPGEPHGERWPAGRRGTGTPGRAPNV